MKIGFHDPIRSHVKVCDFFLNIHPDRIRIISRFVIVKTLRRYNLTGNVQNLPKNGLPKTGTSEKIAQNVAFELEESPQTATTSLALLDDISWRSIT